MTKKDEQPLTISVPQARKRYYGVGRNVAYAAARRGEIPTISVGGHGLGAHGVLIVPGGAVLVEMLPAMVQEMRAAQGTGC